MILVKVWMLSVQLAICLAEETLTKSQGAQSYIHGQHTHYTALDAETHEVNGSGDAEDENDDEDLTTEHVPSRVAPKQISSGCDMFISKGILPSPRIVLLGPTGVGKSTFGNRLLGNKEGLGAQWPRQQKCLKWGKNKKKKEICEKAEAWNDSDGPCSRENNCTEVAFIFGVGHGTESHTVETQWIVGHFLGDTNKPCLTIVDSPGTGDTEGRDCDHAIALARGIKEIGSIHGFMLLFKGTDARFDLSMQDQLELYQNIFGMDMYKNSITEFTYWSHDRHSVRNRIRNNDGLNEEKKHKEWNTEFVQKLQVSREIPSIFINPVYEEDYADKNQIDMYNIDTSKLWNLLKSKNPYQCGKRCKSPSGFFSGIPWINEENKIQNKRLNRTVNINWQIWLAGCDGTGTKSYKILHQSIDGTNTTIFEHVENENVSLSSSSNLVPNLKSALVIEETKPKFKTIQLKITELNKVHAGEYFVVNDKGRSEVGKIGITVDGRWGAWGQWGPCSKECISGNEVPGNKERKRTCIEPKNGGNPCVGTNLDNEQCARRPQDPVDLIMQCPVDAKWSTWTKWSRCTSECEEPGKDLPTKSCTRVCIDGLYGGLTCSQLEEQAIANKELLYTQTENCTELPMCPKSASLGPWSGWSNCPTKCVDEKDAHPLHYRKRPCKERRLSENIALNEDIKTCKQLGGLTERKNCEISRCPVPAEWTPWNNWSQCTKTCGGGTRQRSRGCIRGRHGAARECNGDPYQGKYCNTVKCLGFHSVLGLPLNIVKANVGPAVDLAAKAFSTPRKIVNGDLGAVVNLAAYAISTPVKIADKVAGAFGDAATGFWNTFGLGKK